MYVVYKIKNILTLITIGYIVGLMIGMYIEYCLWAQVAVLDFLGQEMQVLYLGRAPRTKETLPDFLKWRRVTRPPLVFRGLTGSQRTLGFWGVTAVVSFSPPCIFFLSFLLLILAHNLLFTYFEAILAGSWYF